MWILPKNYPLSSHFAQGMVASKEDLSLPGLNIESSLMWRSKPTALPTWLRRWNRVSWLQHLFTRTLKPSHRSSFEERLASSRVAIPVNPFQRQGAEKARTTPDTSGHSYGDTLQQLDLIESFLKMSKVTSRLDCPQLLPTWKKMITEQRGEYSQRVKLAHHTNESASSSWLTPMVQDSKHSGANPGANGRRGLLVNQVNWPTATVFDVTGGSYPTELVNGQWRSKHSKDPNSPWYGAKLRDAVEAAEVQWPTPAARDYKGTNSYERTLSKLADGQRANMGQLPNAVMVEQAKKNWPTPDVAQAQKVSNRPNYGQLGLANHPDVHGRTVQRAPMQKDRLGQPGQDQSNTSGKSQESFGKLNPNWVEQLMGLPIGWTDLGSWGMASCPKQPQKHGGS